ncbi:hypothetical protein A7K99_13420 [Tatumella citrea]|uniref:Uncharacterized protein n=1 Tax=Tatumella citrea TaxID=53336 RepID=A0A1Y0LKW0_TATCI|nr:hypothetical protein A7K98_13435 [Tatumella citrea]ARU98711.1 hypothetical protein A7K99_13420 [Tatumella citrea]
MSRILVQSALLLLTAIIYQRSLLQLFRTVKIAVCSPLLAVYCSEINRFADLIIYLAYKMLWLS